MKYHFTAITFGIGAVLIIFGLYLNSSAFCIAGAAFWYLSNEGER
jgi:hypothetical protein